MLMQRRTFTSSSSSLSWRKEQLDKLLAKRKVTEPAQTIQNDDDLQPMWQAMERRVKNRPLPRNEEGKSGRANIKKTEEDIWLEQGLYDHLNKEEGEDTKSK